MSPEQLSRFQVRLRTLRSRLEANVRQSVDAVGEDSAPPGERVNPLIDEVGLEATIGRSEARLLDKVTAALEHLERGTFGRCEDCGKAIAPGRLEALPYAARCVECEQDLEQSRARATVTAGR